MWGKVGSAFAFDWTGANGSFALFVCKDGVKSSHYDLTRSLFHQGEGKILKLKGVASPGVEIRMVISLITLSMFKARLCA